MLENATQPNWTHGWTKPMSISGVYACWYLLFKYWMHLLNDNMPWFACFKPHHTALQFSTSDRGNDWMYVNDGPPLAPRAHWPSWATGTCLTYRLDNRALWEIVDNRATRRRPQPLLFEFPLTSRDTARKTAFCVDLIDRRWLGLELSNTSITSRTVAARSLVSERLISVQDKTRIYV